MNIVVDDGCHIQLGMGGNVTGEIYFTSDAEYYPEKGWNDFPIIVLAWWINSFLQFKKRRASTLEFDFMDGPYRLMGIPQDEYIQFYFEKCRTDESLRIPICITTEEGLKSELLRACRKLLRSASLAEIPSDKTVGLRELFDELKNTRL